MELTELLVLGTVSCIISALISIIAASVAHILRNRDVERLERKIESEYKAAIGAKGRQNREEKNEEMAVAIGEAFTLIQQGKNPKDIAVELSAKHPGLAMELIMKQLQGRK